MSHAFVVEHTRVEAFESQIRDDVAFERLVRPIETQLAGVLPGRFAATLRFGAAADARGSVDSARAVVISLILANAGDLRDGETIELASPQLPYRIYLCKRHSSDNRIFFSRWIGDDSVSARAERMGRALDEKIPKLVAASAGYGARSVLILESNDVALSNIFAVTQAFNQALNGRTTTPDLVFLIESDASPLYGWLLKDGNALSPPRRVLP